MPPNPSVMILPRQNLSPSYPRRRHGPSLHPAAIFGIVAGVIVLLVMTSWILIFCFCRKALTRKNFGVLRSFRRGPGGQTGGGLPPTGHSNGNGYYGYNNGDTAGQGGYGGGQFPGGMPSGYYQGGQAGAGDGYNMKESKGDTGSGGHGFGNGAGGGDGGASGGGGGGGPTGGGMTGGN